MGTWFKIQPVHRLCVKMDYARYNAIISKLLKCHSKAKHRATAYSRCVKSEVLSRGVVHGKFRSGCQKQNDTIDEEGAHKQLSAVCNEIAPHCNASTYLAKIVYFRSSWLCLAYVMKNCDPLASGPLLAIETIPRALC